MAATASLAVPADSTSATTEYFDVLNEIGAKTGIVKARNHVHRDVTAGDQSLETAQRETQEELGVDVPVEAIEPLFSMQSAFDTNNDTFVNNEFIDVYLVTVKDEVPVDSFTLQQSEVAAVRYIETEDLEKAFKSHDRAFACPDDSTQYMQLFKILYSRRTAPFGSLKTVLGQIGMVQVEYICWQA
ncbi:TPA: hypothetical protein ACH3X2_011221 [Trebouxia sp. C0005]